MTFLLDVNESIALIDPHHASHTPTVRWFESYAAEGWASCPITENGLIRIVGNKQYPNSPGNDVVDLLKEFVSLPGHVFWPDDITLLDSAKINSSRLLTAGQVDGHYLLTLARAHDGKLATLDRRLVVDAVIGGAGALHLVE